MTPRKPLAPGSKLFLVYCPRRGEKPEDAEEITAETPEDAVSQYHQLINDDGDADSIEAVVIGHGEYLSKADYTIDYIVRKLDDPT